MHSNNDFLFSIRRTPFLTAIFVLLVTTILGTCSVSSKPKETLIIVDKADSIATFKQLNSNLIKLVEDLGHAITIKSADDSSLKLSRYGEFLYDNVMVLCSQANSLRGGNNVKDILQFIDAGRNVLIAGNNSPGSIVSQLAPEVGFEFKATSAKRDYPNNKLNDIFYIVNDISSYPSTSFTFSGAQLRMVKSELTLDILNNNAPVDDIRATTNSKWVNNVLIGATQARNNARVVVSGSIDFFSDKAFQSSNLANKHLSNELLKWLFGEKSLLRCSEVTHRKLNVVPEPNPTDIATITSFDGYTIMDDIEYTIKIEIYENGKWSAYTADDVQLEFVRIDPFVRQTLQRQSDGTYLARFKVPDVYGIYKFQVDYRKDGLTHLFSSTQVSVRPMRHNQYERYIYSAYPYYLSAFLMMAYLYLFSFVYLYQNKEKRSNK